MNHMPYFDSLGDSNKSIIANAIADSFGSDVNEAVNIRLKTFISRPFLSWDLLNTKIINSLDHEKFECHISKRGYWKLLLICDVQTGTIFSIMKDDRLTEIRNKNRKVPHYIDILASINSELKAQNKQIAFNNFGRNKFDKSLLSEYLDKLVNGLSHQITTHAIITFSLHSGELTLINASILDSALDIVYEEPWNQYIIRDYSHLLASNSSVIRQTDGIEMTLKPAAFEKKEKNTTKLKGEEQNNQKTNPNQK